MKPPHLLLLIVMAVFPIKAYGQHQGQPHAHPVELIEPIESIEPVESIEPIEPVKSVVPLSKLFHNIGENAVKGVTYNYGLNFMGAVAGTYLFIETGLDREWRNTAYDNPWLSDSALPGLYIGYIVPLITPLVTYTAGRFSGDRTLQVAGLALAQSHLLTFAVQSSLKMITGRAKPGIVTELDHTRNEQAGDLSGEFDWFNFNFIAGWPSGHTANAFAAAATIAEIYPDNLLLKMVMYSYAVFIGLGVTFNVHWSSDALAGALIGYAIGKTVGRSFNALLTGDKTKPGISFYCTPFSIGIKITRF
jgi:membrane-associated phospholipid phosphatase